MPSHATVQARVRDQDQTWLPRQREGPKAARTLRLLTGAHPGASAPWQRVRINSTSCDVLLVREEGRIVLAPGAATDDVAASPHALAAGVPPRQFARDVLGKVGGGADQTVTSAMLRGFAEQPGPTGIGSGYV